MFFFHFSMISTRTIDIVNVLSTHCSFLFLFPFFFKSWLQMFPSNNSEQLECSSRNRIVIYSGTEGQASSVICPSSRSSDDQVKIFSQNRFDVQSHHPSTAWIPRVEEHGRHEYFDIWSLPWSGNHSETGILIEFIAVQSGSYQMKWLELTPQTVHHPAGSVVSLGT